MELELNDAVETTADPVLLWQRMLEPSAVTGLISGGVMAVEAADPEGLARADTLLAEGHTFKVKGSGAGGGMYNARIDLLAPHEVISYTLWRDDVQDSSMLVTYHIDTTGSQTLLAGTITMFIPLDQVLAPGSIVGRLVRPGISWLVRRHASRRLRAQLLTMAGTTSNGKSTP